VEKSFVFLDPDATNSFVSLQYLLELLGLPLYIEVFILA
jgi:hypothetical protein